MRHSCVVEPFHYRQQSYKINTKEGKENKNGNDIQGHLEGIKFGALQIHGHVAVIR